MELIPKWQGHPLTLQGCVELVPTDWLYAIRGVDAGPYADLKNGESVDLARLWEDIKTQGLYDPVIIGVGTKNRKYRLEAGNHRIQLFHQHDIAYVPATVQVQEWCGPEEDNAMNVASHNFDLDKYIDTTTVNHGYAAPSTIFKSLVAKTHPF